MDVDLISFFKKILEIPSPTSQEFKLAEFLIDDLKRRGFNSYMDEIGNVIGEIGGGKAPNVVLMSHIDTVPGFIEVEEKEGKIYGRGSVDAKASVACFIEAATRFSKFRNNFPGKITLIFVVDEEGGAKGTRFILENTDLLKRADYIIYGEPSGTRKITVGYKGRLLLEIECQTTEYGHAGSCWRYENSIEKGYELWKAIKETLMAHQGKTPFQSVSACLTMIDGGEIENTTPEKCRLTIDCRFPPKFRCSDILKMVFDNVSKFREENEGLIVRVTVKDEIEGFQTLRSELSRNLLLSIFEITNEHGKLIRKTGTSDMNLIGNMIDTPIVTYGPGDSRFDHSPNEHIYIDEFLDGIKIAERLLEKLIQG